MKPRVTISIALYNKLEFTKQCLKYLYKNTPHELFNLIIVDNASTDGTGKWLMNELSKYAKINNKEHNYTLLLNDKNVGFAKAHNQAFKECKTEYFLPLNNDTIPLSEWLEPLIEDMDKMQNVAIIGCKLVSPLVQGIQHAGVVFRADGTPIHRYFGIQPDFKGVNEAGFSPAVTGASIIIRSDVYRKLGGFDEIYKNGWEDIDFCLKVRENGWQIFYEPASELYHYEGQTQGRMDNDDRNRIIFMTRWSSRIRDWGNRDYNEYKKEYNVMIEKQFNEHNKKENKTFKNIIDNYYNYVKYILVKKFVCKKPLEVVEDNRFNNNSLIKLFEEKQFADLDNEIFAILSDILIKEKK